MRVVAALALVAACGDDATTTVDASPDVGEVAGWSTGTAVARGAIQETAAVAVDGKVYVIGGFDDDEGIVAHVQIYDTATGTWSDGPDLPSALHDANAATDGTTIFVGGALSGASFAAVGDTYSLAPATETQWTVRTAMPAARARGAAVSAMIAGKLYVAGGYRMGGAVDLVDVYDPATDTWTALAALPATRDHACGGAIDGELIVAGGRTSQNAPLPDVWSFAPGTNTWTARPPMPTGRGGTGCGVIAGALYVTGGEGNSAAPSGVFPQVEAFTPATNTWQQLAEMPEPRHGVGGAVWDGALYLCGGANRAGFGAIASTVVFRP